MNKPSIEATYEFYGLRIVGGDRGGWRKAQCPLPDHEDTNPSASVNTDEGLWRCHACSEGGDAYDIVEKREHVGAGFAETKRRTEAIVGPSDDSVPRQPRGSSLLSRGPRRQRTDSNWVPPWGRV